MKKIESNHEKLHIRCYHSCEFLGLSITISAKQENNVQLNDSYTGLTIRQNSILSTMHTKFISKNFNRPDWNLAKPALPDKNNFTQNHTVHPIKSTICNIYNIKYTIFIRNAILKKRKVYWKKSYCSIQLKATFKRL